MTTTAKGVEFEPGPYADSLKAFRLMFLTRDEKAVYSALVLLKRILQNLQKHPEEDLYHHIRLSAKPVQEILIPIPGSLDVLRSVGFRDAQGSENLEIGPMTKQVCDKIEHVVTLLDAKLNDITHPYESMQDPIRNLESDLGLLKRIRRKQDRDSREAEIEEKIEAAKKERRQRRSSSRDRF